jgi:hypothetical protein
VYSCVVVSRASPQHLVGQPVGDGDVLERHLDVLHALAMVDDPLERALVLVQQRQRADEGEVLE